MDNAPLTCSFPGGWITPSILPRMMYCPASVCPSFDRVFTVASIESGETNLGTIAHKSLEVWVRGGHWKEASKGLGLRGTFEEIGVSLGVDVNEVRGGRTLGIKLARFEPMLSTLIRAQPEAEILPEEQLISPQLGMRGRADLVLKSNHMVQIVEYKTGHSAWAEPGVPSSATQVQIAAYRLLAESEFPGTKVETTLASPAHGFLDLGPDERLGSAIKTSISEYRERISRNLKVPTNPEVGICKLCPIRIDCEPQWRMAHAQNWLDFVDGEVETLLRDGTGRVSLLLKHGAERTWLQGTDLPSDSTLIGRRIRAVRVSGGRSESPEVPRLVRLVRGSDIRIHPADEPSRSPAGE